MAEWFWEGNIQQALALWLVQDGWDKPALADVGMHQPGVDVRTEQSGRELIVEVKGYPSRYYARGPKAGQLKHPSMARRQAPQWFAGALVDAILRREVYPNAEIAIAFPEHPQYRQRIAALEWAVRTLGFGVYFVTDDGSVDVAIEPLAPPGSPTGAAERVTTYQVPD